MSFIATHYDGMSLTVLSVHSTLNQELTCTWQMPTSNCCPTAAIMFDSDNNRIDICIMFEMRHLRIFSPGAPPPPGRHTFISLVRKIVWIKENSFRMKIIQKLKLYSKFWTVFFWKIEKLCFPFLIFHGVPVFPNVWRNFYGNYTLELSATRNSFSTCVQNGCSSIILDNMELTFLCVCAHFTTRTYHSYH